MGITFSLTVFSWIFFRAENIEHAYSYISTIVSKSFFSFPQSTDMGVKRTFLMIMFFVIIEWLGRNEQFAIAKLGLEWKRPIRYLMYLSIILALFWFGGDKQQFIYFQF